MIRKTVAGKKFILQVENVPPFIKICQISYKKGKIFVKIKRTVALSSDVCTLTRKLSYKCDLVSFYILFRMKF
jgi:hypothetical protein